MNLKYLKNVLLKDEKVREEFSRKNLAWEISKMIIDLRILKGVTQEELAKLLKTKQPSVARAESGKYLPSIRFLENIAKVLGTELIAPKFAYVEEQDVSVDYIHPRYSVVNREQNVKSFNMNIGFFSNDSESTGAHEEIYIN